ncbi:MAG TPA: molybdate ABC transporter substrate-binding protein [Vicinamibacterales bacterium]
MSNLWERRLGTIRVVALAAVLAVLVTVRLRSPTHSPPVPVINIAAASDLRFALDELTDIYRKNVAKVAFRVSYGSSGTLYTQVLNGAPFNLFLSADVDYPRRLANSGRTVPGTEFTYGIGRLVVWVPASSGLDIDRLGLRIVVDPRVAHVAIANPAHAPYGRAAEAAMQAVQVYGTAKQKLVLGENVSQAMQFVQSGAAEVGIVALSLAVGPTAKDAGRFVPVPPELYPRLEQSGVVLASPGAEAARAFRSYLLGDAARAVLERYGFSRSGT